MITNRELKGKNWFYSYVHIVRNRGFGGLYSGIRAALGFTIVPMSLSFLFGVPETLIYRCMLDEGIVSKGSPSIGIMSALTTVVVAHKVLAQEGIGSMLRYGQLSCFQVIPGFCSFLCARTLLWCVLGDSKARKRQLQRRREILEEHWRVTKVDTSIPIPQSPPAVSPVSRSPCIIKENSHKSKPSPPPSAEIATDPHPHPASPPRGKGMDPVIRVGLNPVPDQAFNPFIIPSSSLVGELPPISFLKHTKNHLVS